MGPPVTSCAPTRNIVLTTITEAQNHPLWDEQVALEQEMRSLGEHNYQALSEKALRKGQETRLAPVRRLMEDAHHKMVDALEAFYVEVEARKGGRMHCAYKYLKAMDIHVVAHLTSRVILDLGSHRKALTHIAVVLAETLEDECNYRHFREQHKAGFLKAAKRVEKVTNNKHLKKSVMGTARGLGVEAIEWPKRDMILVGSKLVELFIESTGMVATAREADRICIETTKETREWIEKEGRNCALLTPTYMPTLIPPKPWTSPFEGGYWTGRARRLTLLKARKRGYLEELADEDMPKVYQAVNALQDTPWHINRSVYDVMAELWANGSTLGMVPPADSEDPKAHPKPIWLVKGMKKEDMTPEQFEEFKEWKSVVTKMHDQVVEDRSKRKSFLDMMNVAERFLDRDSFFFPYALDWRGRAYPVGHYLHPQGNDMARGLLEFAIACPIRDQEAANWLAIHGAGLWGIDKVSFAERIQWVKDHEPEILACAEDPFSNHFWMWEGEKPNKKGWQALAFAFDWAGFKREGFGYLSALPVQMDGTCNGLQNFSAMLLDERGGAAVNLVPSDKPQDIYMEVGRVVIDRVNREAMAGDEIAALWVGKVERSVVKRPVMTLAYGASQFGFTDQVMEDTVRPAQKKDDNAFGGQGWAAAQYLGKVIWDSVQEVVQAAAEAMKWLKAVAAIVSKEGLPINWRTPTGLRVQQDYRVRNMTDVMMTFEKVRIRLKMDKGSEKLDTRKQASSIAPNWVHSLDASHMMLTICAAADAGMHSFSFIHDSYGTHAANTPQLADMLRQQFVEMYSGGCVLERFKDDLEAMMGVEGILPPVPAKGNLDLQQVLESPFFFA